MLATNTVDALGDDMLVMDAADMLARGMVVPYTPLPTDEDGLVVQRLGELYRQAGIEVTDSVLRAGLAAARDERFVYAPPRGVRAVLAFIYIMRSRWLPPAFATVLVLTVGLGAYFFGYQPYRDSQAERARQELSQNLPATMDALYQQIFNETKVQQAATDADAMRNRGKEAAQQGDRVGAERAVGELTALRDSLTLAYTVRVVDQDGVKPGFWTFPASNAEATNYYIVVEAIDGAGRTLSLPVTSEETGLTQTVSRWGLRVPQAIYDGIIADKQDDGTIQHGLVGFKQDGFPDVDYIVPVLGGAVTQW